jgi:hypothetical protein
VTVPGVLQHETTRPLGEFLRDLLVRTPNRNEMPFLLPP